MTNSIRDDVYVAGATPPPSGDLVERIQSWCTDYRFYGEEMDSIHKEAYNLFAECLTALQGVTISRSCAEACHNALFYEMGADTLPDDWPDELLELRSAMAKAMEHSNGR